MTSGQETMADDGVTGWVHIAHISGDVVNDGATLVSNLNNHLGL